MLSGSAVALNTDDYSNVKNMTISNTSKYGELNFNYVTNKEKYVFIFRDKAAGRLE